MLNASYWLLLIGGWLVCAAWVYHAIRLALFVYRTPKLSDENLRPGVDELPNVCVIVPARDEGRAIERCLSTLAAQDYPRLHIVAVNDRSADETGAIMERIAAVSNRVTVVHIEDLPDGWLGKNHANWIGACHEAARDCDYLLFTDGDVWFREDCIGRAVTHALGHRLDHLCIAPDMAAHGFLEKAMCHFFGIAFMIGSRVWHVANPARLDAFIGVGAFNFVRRKVYDQFGGHEALRLEVLDDFKLGKLMKAAGGRCSLLMSYGAVSVRWQAGLRGIVLGLEKNAVAGCQFSAVRVAWTLAILLVGFVSPTVIGLAAPGAVRWGWLVTAALQAVSLAWAGYAAGVTLLIGFAFPLCAAAMFWALLRAAFLTLRRGGIVWRGTFHTLDSLRRGMV